MKTSLDKLQWREDCLLGRVSGEQQTLFEAKLLLDPVFGDDVRWQRKTYRLIRDYGRHQLREELENIHQMLFNAPRHRTFRDQILGFFRR